MDVGKYNNEMEMRKKKLFTAAVLKDYYHYNGVSHLSSKEKNSWIKGRFKCRIEYFKDGVSLGEFPCLEASTSEIRDAIAKYNDIGDYDCYVLDGGRLSVVKRDGREYMRYRRTIVSLTGITSDGPIYERLISNKEEHQRLVDSPRAVNGEILIPTDLKELLVEREVSSLIP